jgi:CRISPR-associated endonuclease/helicase Cas3
MVGAEGYYAYWGKAEPEESGTTFHRLAYHCLDVAAVGHTLATARPRWADAFASVAGLERNGLERVLAYLLSAHDLGKYGHGFQRQRKDIAGLLGQAVPNVANKPRHDTLSYLLWRELSDGRSEIYSAPREGGQAPDAALLEIQAPDDGTLSSRRRRDLLAPWMAAVAGHHGRPPENVDGALRDHFGVGRAQGPWLDALAFLQAARSLLRVPTLRLVRPAEEALGGLKASSWWLAGFAVLCDWVGSNQEWFPFESEAIPLASYWKRACEAAEKAVVEAGLGQRRTRAFAGFGELFRGERGPLLPSPLQKMAAEVPLGTGPQLFLLEDLTGSGKTEAALTLVARLLDAGRADGFYFALPTMATANAMHSRVGEVLPRLFAAAPPASYVLAHSGPRLRGSGETERLERQPAAFSSPDEDCASQAARNWLTDSRKKALLADAGVGTIDQALVGILRAKHNGLRLLGLHGHVLVVDEVHACDEYMNGLLEQSLQVQAAMGGSAVLLSATLPMGVRDRLFSAFRKGLGCAPAALPDDAYPCFSQSGAGPASVTHVAPRVGSARTVAIEFFTSATQTLDWCCRRSDQGRCVAWIRNTVREALEAYDLLVSRLGAGKVQVFHARFPLGDRLVTEQDVVARFGRESENAQRAGRVVVATQVMEQSLDVDFDDMVSDLAPIDRLVQRCGRMQRHARGDRGIPTLHVLAPKWQESPGGDWPGKDFAGTLRVYPRPSALWRTQRILENEGRLELPARARALVEAVFGRDVSAVPQALLDADPELAADASRLQQRGMAAYNRIDFEQGYIRIGAQWADDERAPTRLGEATTLIRLVREVEGMLEPWSTDRDQPPSIRWRLGEASVAAHHLWEAFDDDKDVRARLAGLDAEPPSHVVPVVMKQVGDCWRGRGRGLRQELVTVVFQHGRGLSFVRNAEG